MTSSNDGALGTQFEKVIFPEDEHLLGNDPVKDIDANILRMGYDE